MRPPLPVPARCSPLQAAPKTKFSGPVSDRVSSLFWARFWVRFGTVFRHFFGLCSELALRIASCRPPGRFWAYNMAILTCFGLVWARSWMARRPKTIVNTLFSCDFSRALYLLMHGMFELILALFRAFECHVEGSLGRFFVSFLS